MTRIPGYLLPSSAEADDTGELTVGGVRLTDLAREYGTPLFVYDERHLQERCAQAVDAFPGGVAYGSKAFSCIAMVRLAARAGMHIDVSTAGEMATAVRAGVAADRLVFHGNNKSEREIATAIELGNVTFVIDSFDEIDRIEAYAAHNAMVQPVRCFVRVTPGIEAHTHEYVMTGQDDTKFGFGMKAGDAQAAADRLRTSPSFDLVGAHAHIGSQIFEMVGFEKVIEILTPFVQKNALSEMVIGGGLGLPYVTGEAQPTFAEWGATVQRAAANAGLSGDVKISAEPGRSIAAGAGITLYTVGTIKELSGIRTYLAVDGGMSDNPRPVLYGSGYEAFLPRIPEAERPRTVTIMGKHCETGDLLVKDAAVPAEVQVGDIIATPVTGAYGYSMASNYNRVPRPAVVFVKDGAARVVIRRETIDDLLDLDVDA